MWSQALLSAGSFAGCDAGAVSAIERVGSGVVAGVSPPALSSSQLFQELVELVCLGLGESIKEVLVEVVEVSSHCLIEL